MGQSILIFDFGADEEGAQLARHKIESWQQALRLGKKMLFKFDRGDAALATESQAGAAPAGVAAKAKPAKKKPSTEPKKQAAAAGEAARESRIRLLIRLGFSDHEKLSQQRWLDRFAAEEPFKFAKVETVHQGSPGFADTADLFDSLD